MPDYVTALRKELRELGKSAPKDAKQVSSIYFGGGTPSLLSPEAVGAILTDARGVFELAEDAEITLEANPGTMSAAYLRGLRASGVNRLSLGIQSFNDAELKAIGRIHDARTARDSIDTAHAAGFEALSLDLIFGLPGQSLASWAESLEEALAGPARHLSLYSLILEEGTRLALDAQRRKVKLPDEDLVADMYELARERLAKAGWRHYEISNWAKGAEDEARHNRVYWQQGDWLGLGAGAHGYCGGWQTENAGLIKEYVEMVGGFDGAYKFPLSPANSNVLRVANDEAMRTFMIFGLRLVQEGISVSQFETRFGLSVETKFGKQIQGLVKRGILEWVDQQDGPHLRLTYAGVPVGNQAFMEFV